VEKSDGRAKPRKEAKKVKQGKRVGNRKPYADDDLIRALNHALRRQILRLLHSSRTSLSPTEIEQKLALGKFPKEHLSTVSYHMTVLAGYKTISLVDAKPVRGAMEHFYESRISEGRWVRDLLKRTQKKDEALLSPKGRPGGEKAPRKEKR